VTLRPAETASDSFVHLHVHSEFSLLDGLSRMGEMTRAAAEAGMPALALTDHGALYGAVPFYQAAIAAGIKPIIGVETYVAPRGHQSREGKADTNPYHLILLARDQTGYRNLIELITDDDYKMTAVWDVLLTRMVRRGVPTKNLKAGDVEPMAGGLVRRAITLQQGIPTDASRDIVKFIKDQKLKRVQAAIQGDQLRISSPSKDELQGAMHLLRAQDFGVELMFGNFRE
jgi:uncharacterized protein YajQ (UPF0234 family)